MNRILFATGIENSYPTVAGGKRRDQMEESGHAARWREDFGLVREIGVSHLRWGPPYYKTHLGRGRYDWSYTDDALARLAELGITPIVDLLHFGVPDWLESFQNPELPEAFAEYAGAFAARRPELRWYTPVNEIFVAAQFSALLGFWNERRRDARSFVTAVKHLCRAAVLAIGAIRAVRPDALFVQSEATQHFHADRPELRKRADFENQLRFLPLDLLYAREVRADMYRWLLDHGLTRDEYVWFMNQDAGDRCILGTDYYASNEQVIVDEARTRPYGETFGWYLLTKQYYQRYHKPVMHTETNIADAAAAPAWLWKQWLNVDAMRKDGIPVVGFTWYGLLDHVDWDSLMQERRGHIDKCGLYDLRRRPHPVARAYRELVAMHRADSLVEHSPFLQVDG